MSWWLEEDSFVQKYLNQNSDPLASYIYHIACLTASLRYRLSTLNACLYCLIPKCIWNSLLDHRQDFKCIFSMAASREHSRRTEHTERKRPRRQGNSRDLTENRRGVAAGGRETYRGKTGLWQRGRMRWHGQWTMPGPLSGSWLILYSSIHTPSVGSSSLSFPRDYGSACEPNLRERFRLVCSCNELCSNSPWPSFLSCR